MLATALIGLSGCAQTAVVHVRDNSFVPAQIEVAAGTVVQFASDGEDLHTVTIHDPGLATVFDERLNQGETVQFTFAAPGDYHVFCRLHEGMALDVQVS